MREIIFRAWDIEKKKMYGLDTNQFGFQFKKEGWSYHDYGAECTYTTSRTGVLMWFTGLKDKNGVPIFEGDIVKSRHGVANVVFHNASFIFKWDFDKLNQLMHVWKEDGKVQVEIIGNIYEHSELLQK